MGNGSEATIEKQWPDRWCNMMGHTDLIAMRGRGYAPKIVFINDYPCKIETEWLNPGERFGEKWPSTFCTISVHKDTISSLDLRFLVGLTVSISALDDRRGKALFEKVKRSGAKTVAIGIGSNFGDWADIYHKEV